MTVARGMAVTCTRREGISVPRQLSLGQLRAIRAFFTLTLVVGVAIMLYPTAQRAYWTYYFARQAEGYDQVIMQEPRETLDTMRLAAGLYNEAHDINVIGDPFSEELLGERAMGEYAALLDPMGNGIMGYLDIPRIEQRINVYHGTSSAVLERGVGHLQGTSLPIGGEGTHCVLVGHRGLAAAKLFTDLDQMAPGDSVYLRVLDETLAYEVEQVQVVLPTEIDSLAIVPGRDLLTLVTCTPYAVNTHRLLVTCHRVPYVETQGDADLIAWLVRARLALVVAGLVVCLVVAVMAVRHLARMRRRTGSAR